jgi:formate-dependent nitrite reductase cytochrome c552 subunit
MEVEWTCPFCKNGKIKLYFREGFTQSQASSIAAGKKYTKQAVGDKVENVGCDCSECGKTAEEIKKAFDKGIDKEITPDEHQKRIERLKAAGFGTKLVNTRR